MSRKSGETWGTPWQVFFFRPRPRPTCSSLYYSDLGHPPKQFRELRVAPSMPGLVVENSHPYTISVARQKGFQNMEFLTKESLKPYDSELKPLLRWWKSARDMHVPETNTDVDSRCSLTDAEAIFNN